MVVLVSDRGLQWEGMAKNELLGCRQQAKAKAKAVGLRA